MPIAVENGEYLVSSLSASMSGRVLTSAIRGGLQEEQLGQQSSTSPEVVAIANLSPDQQFSPPLFSVDKARIRGP